MIYLNAGCDDDMNIRSTNEYLLSFFSALVSALSQYHSSSMSSGQDPLSLPPMTTFRPGTTNTAPYTSSPPMNGTDTSMGTLTVTLSCRWLEGHKRVAPFCLMRMRTFALAVKCLLLQKCVLTCRGVRASVRKSLK